MTCKLLKGINYFLFEPEQPRYNMLCKVSLKATLLQRLFYK